MKGNIMPSMKGKTFDQPTKPVPPADRIAEAKALVAEDFDHFIAKLATAVRKDRPSQTM
jgi:hypothetical protein